MWIRASAIVVVFLGTACASAAPSRPDLVSREFGQAEYLTDEYLASQAEATCERPFGSEMVRVLAPLPDGTRFSVMAAPSSHPEPFVEFTREGRDGRQAMSMTLSPTRGIVEYWDRGETSAYGIRTAWARWLMELGERAIALECPTERASGLSAQGRDDLFFELAQVVVSEQREALQAQGKTLTIDLETMDGVAQELHTDRATRLAEGQGIPAAELSSMVSCPPGRAAPSSRCAFRDPSTVVIRFGRAFWTGSEARLGVTTYSGTEARMVLANATAVFERDTRTGAWKLTRWIPGATT